MNRRDFMRSCAMGACAAIVPLPAIAETGGCSPMTQKDIEEVTRIMTEETLKYPEPYQTYDWKVMNVCRVVPDYSGPLPIPARWL